DGAGAPRVLARPLRDGDPSPRAHRGARGAGALRGGPEGLQRDAPQAEPGPVRAHHRPRARGARQPTGRTGERGALARTGHLALVRRADHPAGLDGGPGLHAEGLHGGDGGTAGVSGADAGEPRSRRRARVLAGGAARPRRPRHGSRGRLPDRPVGGRSRVGRGGELPRAAVVRPGGRATAPGAGARRALRSGGRPPPPRRGVRPAGQAPGERGRMSETARLRGRGKVRDIYEAGEHLLLVASDPISDKGRVLTGLSLHWFERTRDIVTNHLVSADRRDFPEPFRSEPSLAGRAMLV